jgi:hypothetical protein
MRDFRKSLILVVILLTAITITYASDWCGSFSIRAGRTDSDCDIESNLKTLFMYGGSFEMWYKNVVSIGPYVYFSQLHSGPLDPSIVQGTWSYPDHANYRAYIAGLDLKARIRPDWKYINVYFPDQFISRIAPYVDGGAG